MERSDTLISKTSEAHTERESQWYPGMHVIGVRPSQEEIGDGNGVESKEDTSGSAVVLLPPRPVYQSYMKPPSQFHSGDDPILKLALQPFRCSAGSPFEPSLGTTI